MICRLPCTPCKGNECPTCRAEREEAKRVIEERLRRDREERNRLIRDVEEWLKGHERGGVGGSLSVVGVLAGLKSLSGGRGFRTKGGCVKRGGSVTMDFVTLFARPITRDQVLAAFRHFDSAYRDTNDYDRWLDNRTYKYALRQAGRLYPCKFILSVASGCDLNEFGGGQQTNNKFRRLGFEVIDKP